MISDYEAGLALAASEWIARGAKPIAEIGSRKLSGPEEAKRLKEEIQGLIGEALEPGLEAYVLRLPDIGMWAYGLYRYPWALEARLYLEQHDCPDWLQGLVFGYNSAAIQSYLARSPEQASKSRPCGDAGRGETSRPCSARFGNRSLMSDRFPTAAPFGQL
ncbi:MAG TPA: hypothetical protein VLV83_13165, partial [Acidobacteriota bacterium]|nr:hypothetical protein [Acidobacteriota bacterium]